jgi:peptide/nickel transport system permease protein
VSGHSSLGFAAPAGIGQPGGTVSAETPLRRAGATESMRRLVWRRFRRHRLALAGLATLLALAMVAFGVPLFVPEEAANRLVVTAIRQPPSAVHPFGTDDVGRDIFLRSIFGGRISLRIGFLAALLSVTIGIAVGAIAGYNQGWIDNGLMRFTDALLSIPTLFILIVLTQVAGQSIAVITIVIGVLSWMGVSRLVRANVLSLTQQDFVLAARAIGVGPGTVLVRHILPNTLAPVVVAATLGVGQAIILEASLSFLGLGVQPPTATWGNMLYRAQSFLVTAPWIAFFPGILILITVLCVNFVGDGLRDAFDPRSLR